MILVTGGCGYIGSHTVLALRDAGERVVVLDDLSNGNRHLCPDDVQLIVGDCGDSALLEEIHRECQLTAIMHFAGKIVVPESVENPLLYYLGNTSKSRDLIEFAVRHDLTFIFSSTAAVYGVPSVDAPISESETKSPISPYGRSKLQTEWVIEDCAAAYGLKYAILRYFNVAGADPMARAGQMGRQSTHLVRAVAMAVNSQDPEITIYGGDFSTRDGTCIRDYIHVTDLADAHLAALRAIRAGQDRLTINCGYGQGVSVLEVIRTAEVLTGKPIRQHIGPRRAGDPPALVADNSRILNELDWRPKLNSLETILRTAIAWQSKISKL